MMTVTVIMPLANLVSTALCTVHVIHTNGLFYVYTLADIQVHSLRK